MQFPKMEYWAHQVVVLVLVVVLQYSCVVVVDAQGAATTNPASLGVTFKDNLKSTMSVMLLALFSAFLIMGLFSLYLRHCSYAYGGAPTRACSPRRGFNRQLIDKCPVLVYSAVKDLRIGKGAALECAVCLTEFQDYDSIRLLPKCHHVFHPDCIDSWLLSHMSCPVCRSRLTLDVADVVIPIPDDTTTTATTHEQVHQLGPQQSGTNDNNNQEQQSSSTSSVTVTATASEPVHEVGPQQSGTNEDNDNKKQEQESSSVTVTVTEAGEVVTHTEEECETDFVPQRESRMLVRSHSTGHSLVGPEEKVEIVVEEDRYTLRLPEHARKRIPVNHGKVILPREWSAKRVWYRGRNYNVERWSLSMTPPLEFRWGDGNFLGTCWTPLRVPFRKVQEQGSS